MTATRGAIYDDLSPNAIVSVLPKKGKTRPTRYLSDRLTNAVYTDSGSRKTTKIEISLRNDDEQLLYDKDLMRKGTVLGFSFGYPGLMVDAGQFTIKNHKGRGGVLTITAVERKRGKMARKKLMRLWEGKTRSFVVREVLSNHFPDNAIHIDDSVDLIDSITQRNEHDWQFCYRQAQLAQFELYIDEKGVHFQKPRRSDKPSRLLRYVKSPIGLGEIRDYSFDGISTGLPGRVVLSGRDPLTKKSYTVTVDKTTATDLGELVETAGADDPDEGDREDRGDTGNEVRRNTGAKTEAEAKELAQAMFKSTRWGALKMQLEIIGDPTVRSRTVVLVWGIGPALDGLWWVKQAQHTFGAGYMARVDLTREGIADKLRIKRPKGKKKDDGEATLALHQYTRASGGR